MRVPGIHATRSNHSTDQYTRLLEFLELLLNFTDRHLKRLRDHTRVTLPIVLDEQEHLGSRLTTK